MRVLQIFSLVLGLALTANAIPGRHLKSSQVKPVQRASNLNIKDFLISDVYAHSFLDPAETTWNRTISFVFNDLNSNTSTICTNSWSQTNDTNNAPFSYVLCDATGAKEIFQWQFTSYSSLKSFQIEFAHIFSDPIQFPPPFDIVEYFSAPTNFSLACVDAAGLSGCTLPGPVHAPVDAISN